MSFEIIELSNEELLDLLDEIKELIWSEDDPEEIISVIQDLLGDRDEWADEENL